eukprot:3876884-Pleurochrysis_carterae.AAC.1
MSLARPSASDSRTTSLPAVKSTVPCPRILNAVQIPKRFQALASRLPQSTGPTGIDSSALRVAVPARLAARTALCSAAVACAAPPENIWLACSPVGVAIAR